jgi:hypothetical protein
LYCSFLVFYIDILTVCASIFLRAKYRIDHNNRSVEVHLEQEVDADSSGDSGHN